MRKKKSGEFESHPPADRRYQQPGGLLTNAKPNEALGLASFPLREADACCGDDNCGRFYIKSHTDTQKKGK